MKHPWPLGAAALALLTACAAGNSGGTFTGGPGGAGGDATTGTGGSIITSSSTGSGGGIITGSGGSGGGGMVLAYAHTGKDLYSFDPATPSLAPVKLGTFDCIGGSGQDSAMTDIAVNQDGDLWGVSNTSFYHLVVQGSTIHCASTTNFDAAAKVAFYGMTFAPVGALDPTKEVLVAGNNAGELWAIDSAGNVTQHGTFGNVPSNDGHGHSYKSTNVGKRWELSGDIVFLANNGNPVGFATVRDCPSPPSQTNCNPVDTLIEINVSKLQNATTGSVTASVRGQIVKRQGCSDAANPNGYGSMYGIAAVENKVYGFTHSGTIVEIDNNDGSACAVQNSPALYWDGAGVTTVAPVIVPPA